ncbi:uncharacterized protein TrAtP1_010962 [Trichoderma atroviride]|uniref:uncharacterized protein n=1 Tax=Hypocrea atroviridis TaxID=63577 RepID=UPI003331647D|nr:hypothetical protein TrAtP1_010962 [Trichoderma atroviride]
MEEDVERGIPQISEDTLTGQRREERPLRRRSRGNKKKRGREEEELREWEQQR